MTSQITKQHLQDQFCGKTSLLMFFGDPDFLIDVVEFVTSSCELNIALSVTDVATILEHTDINLILTDDALWNHLHPPEETTLGRIEEELPVIMIYAYQFHEEGVGVVLTRLINSAINNFKQRVSSKPKGALISSSNSTDFSRYKKEMRNKL